MSSFLILVVAAADLAAGEIDRHVSIIAGGPVQLDVQITLAIVTEWDWRIEE